MGKKNKKAKAITITRESLLSSLKKIYLGGAIAECLLDVHKGKATCEVVDITNSIVVLEKRRVGSKNWSDRYGLGNIEVLIKFLSSIQDKKLVIKTTEAGRMIIAGEDKRRRLDYLTTLPNLVSTRLRMDENDDQDYAKEFRNMTSVSINISSDFIKDFNSYLSVLKSKIITIKVEDDECTFILGASTEHQFQLSIQSEHIDNEGEEDITVQTNGENVAKVFSVMEMDGDELPTISIGEDTPVIVEDGTTMWALTPYNDDTEEEE